MSLSCEISSEFVFCLKKWSRNQSLFVNAHNYKSLQILFSTCYERNAFFSKLAFYSLTFRMPYLGVELSWENLFFLGGINTSFSPLCNVMKIKKLCFPTLCRVSQIASHIFLIIFPNFSRFPGKLPDILSEIARKFM